MDTSSFDCAFGIVSLVYQLISHSKACDVKFAACGAQINVIDIGVRQTAVLSQQNSNSVSRVQGSNNGLWLRVWWCACALPGLAGG